MSRAPRYQLTRRHIEKALTTLSEQHAGIAQAIEQVGFPEERRRAHGFDALARIIVGQQVSTKAAAAIAGRLTAALGGEISADSVISVPDDTLRAAGLSGQKVGYLRALTQAVLSDALPVSQLHMYSDHEVTARITAVKGFGEWSAHMYLMFSLGRTDIWPTGDLAVRAGFGRLMSLDTRPTPRETRDLAEVFAPYRSSLALLSWKFYSEAPL